MEFECPSSCPFVVAAQEPLRFPVGQIHRVGTAQAQRSDEEPAPTTEVDETRRNVFKLFAVAGLLGLGAGGVAEGAVQYAQPPVIGLKAYPRVQLLDVNGSPLTATNAAAEYNSYTPDVYLFDYPLTNEPNFFLNLAPPAGETIGATNVPGGVGPQNAMVAYSAICQHLGCEPPNLSYYPPTNKCGTVLGYQFFIHCVCHGSTYNPADKAHNITGPAIYPLPQLALEWMDPSTGGDDTIWAIGMVPGGQPVKGHLNTLQGGYGVSSQSQLSKVTPIVNCNFPS
jgi:Rieske Fe-S protein